MVQENHTFGISCAITGMVAMSVMDVVIKWLSPDYPLHEIVLVRTIVALVLISIILQYEGGFGLLKTRRPMLHLLRGLMIAVANMTFYVALAVMPIAEVAALFYVAPLIITGLSGPLLGERVGLRQWVAISIGFIGVMLTSGLGTVAFRPETLLPVFSALGYALTQLLTRKLGVTDKASVMSFYMGIVFLVVSLAFGIFVGDGRYANVGGAGLEFLFRPWHLPTSNAAMLMVACGFLVAIATYMLSQAYRITQANVIAPFEYIVLPLAIFWGFMFWDEIPNLRTMIGIVLIGGAGLYVFLYERFSPNRAASNA